MHSQPPLDSRCAIDRYRHRFTVSSLRDISSQVKACPALIGGGGFRVWFYYKNNNNAHQVLEDQRWTATT